MKKYFGFIMFLGLALSLVVIPVYAKDEESSGENVGRPKLENKEARDAFKAEREASEKKMREDREAFKESAKEDRELLREKTKEEREALHEELKAEREVLRENIKTEREAFKEELKTEKDAFVAELKLKKEEWKNTRSEKKLEFCEKAKETFSNKFESAITKLGDFHARISEIVTKLKADGKDIVAAEEALSLSQSKLADAKAKLDGIKEVVPENSCENMTGEVFEQIKLQAREAKDLLKESKNYLHDSIKELKTLRGLEVESENESADDTSTTTN